MHKVWESADKHVHSVSPDETKENDPNSNTLCHADIPEEEVETDSDMACLECSEPKVEPESPEIETVGPPKEPGHGVQRDPQVRVHISQNRSHIQRTVI